MMTQSLPILRQPRFWIILGLLLVSRFLFASRVVPTPALMQARGGDESYYLKIAQHLLQFHEYKEGNLVVYRPPAYPTFVAAMLILGSGHFWCLQLAQNILFLGSTLLLCMIVAPIWGLRASLWCGVLLLINPVWLMIPQEMLSETLFVFWLTLALFFTARFIRTYRIGWLVSAGIVFGVSALTREIGLYFGIGLVLCLLLRHLTTGTRAIVCVASMFMAILPWTIRNYEKLHGFVLVDTNGPINFYEGNNPAANGRMHWALPPGAQQQWNKPGTEMMVYHQAQAGAIAYIRSSPLKTLGRLPSKAWFLWGPIAVNAIELNADTAFRMMRFVFWIPFALLAVYGLVTNARNWVVLTVCSWAVITTLIHLLTIAQPLYRSPIEFFFALPAAVAVCRLRDYRKNRSMELESLSSPATA